MPVTDQTSTFISECMNVAQEQLNVLDKMWNLFGRWSVNGVYDQINGNSTDIQTGGFPHLSDGKTIECINAFKAVMKALGNEVEGEPVRNYLSAQESNLLKMKG